MSETAPASQPCSQPASQPLEPNPSRGHLSNKFSGFPRRRRWAGQFKDEPYFLPRRGGGERRARWRPRGRGASRLKGPREGQHGGRLSTGNGPFRTAASARPRYPIPDRTFTSAGASPAARRTPPRRRADPNAPARPRLPPRPPWLLPVPQSGALQSGLLGLTWHIGFLGFDCRCPFSPSTPSQACRPLGWSRT